MPLRQRVNAASQRRPASVPRILTGLLVLGLLLPLQPAAWASTEAKLEEARKHAAALDNRIASAEKELAALEVELDELGVELDAVAEELAVAEEAHRAASAESEEATRRSDKADRELADAEAEQDANDENLQKIARDTYKHGLTAMSPELAVFEFASQSDAESLGDRLHYLQRGMGERTAVLDEAVALVTRVDRLAEEARREAGEKDRLLAIAEDIRAESAEAHARLEQLLADMSVKLARQDELVQELEEDRRLAGMRIGELEEQLERERIERERRERERREREERERREREERKAAERAAAKRASSSGGGGGGGGGGNVSSSPAGGGLVTVGGITVAASLGPQLEALLNDARADGIRLGGWGYRSPEATARLRIANGCPDVHDSPASSCRVPTARPGQSEHEKGLAVDFTYNGQTICFPRPGSQCRGNPAFDWLKANAGKYGLRNLSTEAWHWSTTGR